MFKVNNNGNGVLIDNFDYISHIFLPFSVLTLNRLQFAGIS